MKNLSKERFSIKQVVLMFTIVILGIAVISYGAVTIPNTFSSGETISSSEVNGNFTAVAEQMPAVKTASFAYKSLTSNSYSDIGSISVTVPGAGNIYLTANGTIYTQHDDDLFGDVWVGICDDSSSVPADVNKAGFTIRAGEADDLFIVPYYVSTVFQVTAGTHTFHLVAAEFGQNDMNGCGNNRLTAMYIPNDL